MTEINTEDYILGLNPETATEEELQEVYIKTIELCNDIIDDDYKTWNTTTLMYEVAYNIFDLDGDNKKYLYKACEFNDLIEITKEDSSMVYTINMFLRQDLLEKLTEFSDQESLDKAYDILNQMLLNPEGIDIKRLIRLTEGLLDKYSKIDKKKNEDKINNLTENLKKFKRKRKKVKNYILGLNPETLEIKKLREAYVKTIELCNDIIDDDYKTWDTNKLMYEVAYNIFDLDGDNKKYLYKACEFNDLIEITKEDSSMVVDLNYFLRQDLLEKLTEFSDQESLDKAYDILNQMLLNPEGIDIKRLIRLTEGLLDKYSKIDKKKNKDKINNLTENLKNLKEEVEEFIKLSKKYFLDENMEVIKSNEKKNKIYKKITDLISNSNVVSEYVEDTILKSMNYSSDIGTVIDMINAGSNLNKIKEKSVSTMFKKLVTATLKRKEVSEQKIEEEKKEIEKMQKQSNDLNSINKEFNITEAEQQATTLNEDIDNYSSVTNEFSDEMEEEFGLALLFG